MKVLVAVASRHGSTAEIARHLADRLQQRGHATAVHEIGHEPVRAIDDYDAAVVGSAIYEGRWLRAGRTFVLDNASSLQRIQVFLFSSGPTGTDAEYSVEPAAVDQLVRTVDAVEHRLFAGRIDRAELGRLERWIVNTVRAVEGDHRDWAGIDAWADAIDAQLRAPANAT
jgi:menaquinone-dependent protoporphyrinogen oxidase